MKTLILGAILALWGYRQDSTHVDIHPEGPTIIQRIPAPAGYTWIEEEADSWGAYLQHAPLKPPNANILDYTQQPISNQHDHVAVLDYDIGRKDLQQCADVVIRLRAEYLWAQKRYDEIAFHFTSGHLLRWEDYKNGIRAQVQGNKVEFVKTAGVDGSLPNFRRYLDIIYMYAGTRSLPRETRPVHRNEEIATGDILLTPGSPGHVALIVGRARDSLGNVVYLLAQGYTPAQSIHIMTNPSNGERTPWYDLCLSKHPTYTPRYTFERTHIRTFE
jgi:hypothetical protein